MSELNSYYKYAPNVWLAKCHEKHERGSIILVANRYGDEKEHIVHNLIAEKGGSFYYSITRADGFNCQERAKNKEARLLGAASNAQAKSNQAWKASHEGSDFLSLGEPIKIGHHSEKRHRALIERNHKRMAKSVELDHQAQDYERRAAYWASRAADINLSMPESCEYYVFELEKAKAHHADLKANPEKRAHSFALTYAKKKVKELESNVALAQKLWGVS